MKNFLNALFNFKKPATELRPTIILKSNTVINEVKQKELEDEYSKKLNANVVILDGKFSGNVEIYYK